MTLRGFSYKEDLSGVLYRVTHQREQAACRLNYALNWLTQNSKYFETRWRYTVLVLVLKTTYLNTEQHKDAMKYTCFLPDKDVLYAISCSAVCCKTWETDMFSREELLAPQT